MEATWTCLADLEERIDAEYYRDEFVEAAKQLDAHVETQPIGQLWNEANRIYIGIAGFDRVDSPSEFTRYLRPVDITEDGFIDYEQLPWCKREWLVDHGKKGCAKPGDLIIEVKENTRKAAVVTTDVPANCIVSGSSYRVRLNPECDSHFIQLYLLTELGQKLKRRLTSNTTISYIDPESFRNYRLPIPDNALQKAIGHKVRKVECLRCQAKVAKQSATRTLDRHLLFRNLDSPIRQPTWSTVSKGHGRLDAEYYQHCYLQIDEYIATLPETIRRVDYLADLIHDGAYGVLPPSETYGTGDLPFLRAQDVREFFVEFRNPVLVPRSYENRKALAAAGDLLLEVKGAIEGVAICPDEADGFLVNGSVYRAGVNKGIHPYYLMAILTAPFGRLQKQRAAANSIISYLSSDFLDALVVPRINEAVEIEIGSMLETFCELSYAANRLLAVAKQDVEELIAGTLDEGTLVQKGKEAAAWLESNASGDISESW